jgi:hypothetical protein
MNRGQRCRDGPNLRKLHGEAKRAIYNMTIARGAKVFRRMVRKGRQSIHQFPALLCLARIVIQDLLGRPALVGGCKVYDGVPYGLGVQRKHVAEYDLVRARHHVEAVDILVVHLPLSLLMDLQTGRNKGDQEAADAL